MRSPTTFVFPFNEFHPLRGKFPDSYPPNLNDIAKRAREILKRRSALQIQHAYLTANWLFHSYEIEFFVNYKVPRSKKRKHEKEGLNFAFYPQDMLLDQILKIDISRQKEFPRAKWEEYFAALALGLLGESYSMIHRKNSRSSRLNTLHSEISSLWMEASGAMAMANSIIKLRKEGYLRKPKKNQESPEKRRLRNIRAAEIKNAPGNRFKRECCLYWESEGRPPKRKAVKDFLNKFSPSRRLLSEKTLYEALIDYDKGRIDLAKLA